MSPPHRRIIIALLQSRPALRWLLPALLILLFALIWFPWQAQQMEANERQGKLNANTLEVEQTIRFQLRRNEETLGLIGAGISTEALPAKKVREHMQTLLRNNPELLRILWLDSAGNVRETVEEAPLSFSGLTLPSRTAAYQARETKNPQYSQPAPPLGMNEPIQMDYHVPLYRGNRYMGSIIASYSMRRILDNMVPWWFAQENDIALADSNRNIIAKRATGGRGIYTHQRALDLPGVHLSLHIDSIQSRPKLLPNLLVGAVIALSLGLVWSLWALWRHINRRLAAEQALRHQVSFRTAMENSLMTGMHARDLEGRITYVNPAFCNMIGMQADDLLGQLPPMPYWPHETMHEYQERFSQAQTKTGTPKGFETTFQRANGERFPVLIFESPFINDHGEQTGWMSSILDISDRKRIEDLNRQQQEQLQASARLSIMGEIASTLAHELNQPLAAISSYVTGALNLMNNAAAKPERSDPAILKPVLEKVSAQAQRAGHIIRSVHTFVKKREPLREKVTLQALIDNIAPLIELQAQPFFVTLQIRIAPQLPAILADRVLVEQVLLNLTRNAIEAMEHTAPEQRILCITAEPDLHSPSQGHIAISVLDHGHGITPDVEERLFSPFFSTKAEGMGMGLNICRTAVEFHGGTLSHSANPAGRTIFRFTLPATIDTEIPLMLDTPALS